MSNLSPIQFEYGSIIEKDWQLINLHKIMVIILMFHGEIDH